MTSVGGAHRRPTGQVGAARDGHTGRRVAVPLFDTDADRGLSEVDTAARLIELGPNGRVGFG